MALITPYSQRARTPDAIGASVKDGTVMDHRTASAPTEYARILRILGDSEDADVRAFSKVPGKKIPTESVEVFENGRHV